MIEDPSSLPAAADRREVGRRIRATRQALGMSQKAVYEKLGISKQTYNNHDTGYSRPSIEDGIRISRLFGVSLEWIYLGEIRNVPHELAIKLQKLLP